MNINDKIIQIINIYEDPTMIEITPIAYKKVREDILEQLEEKNIKVNVTENVKEFKVYNYKVDCFAYQDKQCSALTEIDCRNCSFYRNDISRGKIESAVRDYIKK